MIMDDYVDTPASPLFPFGHGLSYTTWERSDSPYKPQRQTTTSRSVSPSRTRAVVRELTSSRSIFVMKWLPSASRQPGSSPSAGGARRGRLDSTDIPCASGRLGFTGADLRYRVEPGEFTFIVGDLSETANVTGEVAFPDRNAAPAGDLRVAASVGSYLDLRRDDHGQVQR